MSAWNLRVIWHRSCRVSIPKHSLPRRSENYIRIVAAASIPKSLFHAVARHPRSAAPPSSSFRFSILLNGLIWIPESFPYTKLSVSALWRPWCAVTRTVATSIGTFDQSDQGSLVSVRPLSTSHMTILLYLILHNATVLFMPVALSTFLRTHFLPACRNKARWADQPASTVRERATSANVFGIMLGTAT